MGYSSDLTVPGLSALANETYTLPNFVSHQPQTIRGLYSMLCGDYPKMLNDTPKPFELMSLDSPPTLCLPHLLGKIGYSTHYFQAANLQFMSKDTVMPALGFDDVRGKESFQLENDYYFHWGPDDALFFEQSLQWIKKLEQKPDPWFATLLTVGTHHPFAVPANIEEGKRKHAAVLAADRAVYNFIRKLQAAGIDKNTLILITSDESHGILGHRFGHNWGFMSVLAPDIAPGFSDGVFGSVDISLSVLDYLDYGESKPKLSGRSFFRNYAELRQMPFAQWSSLALSTGNNKILVCPRQRNSISRALGEAEGCQKLNSLNGKLFSNEYAIEGTASGKESDLVYELQRAIDSRYSRRLNGRPIHYNRDTRVRLHSGQRTELLGGQFFTLPAGGEIEIQLDMSFSGPEATVLKLEMFAVNLMKDETGRSFFRPMDLPPLVPGERLKLNLRAPIFEDFSHGQTKLMGTVTGGDGLAVINRYSIVVKQEAKFIEKGVQLAQGLIEAEGETPRPLSLTTDVETGRHHLYEYAALEAGEALLFNSEQALRRFGASGFWESGCRAVWTKAAARLYIAEVKGERPASLKLRGRAFLQEGEDFLSTDIYINEYKLGRLNITGHWSDYSLDLPSTLELDQPFELRLIAMRPLIAPHDIDPTNTDKRRLGIAVEKMSFR